MEGLWNICQRFEAIGDIDSKIDWLKELLRVASSYGNLDYTLQAFSELRRIYNTDARYADLRGSVLWYYKWLVDELPHFSDISLKTIEEVFKDMQECYQQEGESLRPVYSLRCQAAVTMGHNDADSWYEKWQAEPKGDSDDCPACEADRQIIYFLEKERLEDAFTVAEPILSGEVYCDDTPQTLSRLIGPAMQLDKRDLGLALLHASGRYVRHVPKMLSSLASHIVYRFFVGDFQRSYRLAILGLHRAKKFKREHDLFNLYRACGMWASLCVVARLEGISIPRDLVPGCDPSSKLPIALTELAGMCLAEAQRLAKKFDSRNVTDRYQKRFNEVETMIRKVVESAQSSDSSDTEE